MPCNDWDDKEYCRVCGAEIEAYELCEKCAKECGGIPETDDKYNTPGSWKTL